MSAPLEAVRIRSIADGLEGQAVELRRLANLLEGGGNTGNPETVAAPPQGKSLITPEVAGYGLTRVRCSGCPERPDCSNILERKRIGKVNKCRQCHSAQAITRSRLYNAKRRAALPAGTSRKRALPTLKKVCCSGCPQRPNCTSVVKRYRVQKVNKCWKCVDAEATTSAQRYQSTKRRNGQPMLRSVWHGGEGLSRCSASSLSRDSFEGTGN